MKRLEGKIAVVTGGTSGIGFATAQLFAAEGARVFITGRRQSALDTAVAQLGASVTGIRSDSASVADLDRLFALVREQADQIDVLFVNAGGGEFAALEAVTEEHFDKTFDSNVKGVLFTVQKALPLLRAGSSIILNASNISVKGAEAFSVYAATKAAVRSFARSWAAELRMRQIRVNAISPGPINTLGLSGLAGSDEAAAQLRTMLAASVPLGRLGTPDEVAKAALFLATDDSSFVTGIELFVDGGLSQI